VFAGGSAAAGRYHGPVPGLYPDVPVFHTEQLPVGDGHAMQVQHGGSPGGIPVLLLHGGPGSGQSPLLRRAFDPARFHLIAPDQRGAGGSTPAGDTAHNTLAHLLADLRLLREHLGLERWLVVGGSWGATLALAHAADAPHAVSGLLLRASFLARPADIDGFFDPAGRPLPAHWAALALAAGEDQPSAMAAALHQVLEHGAPPRQAQAALAWAAWEQALAGTAVDHASVAADATRQAPAAAAAVIGRPGAPGQADPAALIQRYRVQASYLANNCWMTPSLLHRASLAPPVPTLLLHADDDAICAPQGARALQAALPQAQLRWAVGAGHNPAHPAMAALQRCALDHWARHACWPAADDWPRA